MGNVWFLCRFYNGSVCGFVSGVTMKSKKFSELSAGKKFLFFISLLIMIGVLVFTGFNLDTLIVNGVVIEEPFGCTWKFDNGILSELTCPDGFYLDDSLVGNYTLVEYYEDRNPRREVPFADINIT